MRLKLKTKVVLLAVIAALLPVLVIQSLTYVQKQSVVRRISDELDLLAKQNIAQIDADVYSMCSSSFDLMRGRLEQGLDAVTVILTRGGGVILSSETADWKVKYPDGSITNLTVPVLMFDGKPFTRVDDFAESVPLVDDVKELSSLVCSVFLRLNEQGDMLRVASTVLTPDGHRAVATVLTAVRGDGLPDPVVTAILSGQMYRGLNPTLGEMFLTAYKPLLDAKGKVIGMLGVGWRMDAGDSLLRAIKSIKVGKSGYVWVIGGKGALKGIYILSKDGERDGENVFDEKDENNKQFVQEVIAKATAGKPGDVQFIRYPWRNPGETESRMKIAAYTYFEPWDWVIAASAYEDDYFEARNHVGATLRKQGQFFALLGVAVLAIAMLLAIVLGLQLTRPLQKLNSVASMVADGNLTGATRQLNEFGYSHGECETAGRMDEAGQLACAFMKMAKALSSLVGQVQRSGIQVTTSTTQIAASARQLEATVTEQAASTNQVTATSKEISQTSQQLVNTMENVASGAVETASLAGASQTSLRGMEDTMRQLMEATGSISSRLSTISEKANNIESIVTTISKVADQTNLLSLNAAIEAEKAGEYGMGFSVVAQEIRRLADQTAVATLNIENMVKDMHSAVSAGVMEMDKFIDQVRRGVQEVGKIGERMGGIIGQVQTLTPQFEQVRQGMQAQNEGAEQISHAMMQLSEAAAQTKTSLQEFNKAASQLTSAVQDLRQEVSRFKVG